MDKLFKNLTHTQKGILSVVAAVCAHLMIGNLFTYGNINKYYASYIHIKKKSFGMKKAFWIFPLGLFFQNNSPFFGGILEKKIGLRLLLLVTLCTTLIGHIIMLFAQDMKIDNFPFILIGISIYGFGNGLIYFTIIRNGWAYFPNRKGLISGIIIATFGITPCPFTAIANAIINPHHESPVEDEFFSTNDEKEKFYRKEVAEKVRDFIKYLMVICIVLGIVAFILVQPYKKEKKEEKEEKEETPKIEAEDNGQETKDVEKQEEEKKKEDDDDEDIWVALKSKRFVLSIIFGPIVFFHSYSLTNTYRDFGSRFSDNEKALQVLSELFYVFNAGFRVLWGTAYDYVSFHKMYIAILAVQTICSAALYFSAKNIYLYCVVCCISVFSFGGHATIFPTYLGKVFGMKNNAIIIGVVYIVVGISGLLGPTLIHFLVHDKKDFLIFYMIGCGLTIIAFVILFFINDSPFDYKSSKQEQNLISGIDNAPLVNNQSEQDIPEDKKYI